MPKNSITLEEVSHVIWDWNGTLVDDAPFSWGIFNTLAGKRGLSAVSFEYYQSIYGHPVQDMYTKAGFDFQVESFDVIAGEWHSLYTEGRTTVSLHNDAREVLQRLHGLGIKQAVLSALPHALLRESVIGHSIDDFFVEIRGLEDLRGHSKVENAHALLRKLEAQPQRTLVIGDSTHDAEVAHAIGAQCVLVDRGYEDRVRLERHGFRVARSLEEIFTR